MIDAGANDDCALALGQFRGRRPLARKANDHVTAHPRVFLRPCRSVGRFVIVASRVLAFETARHAILGHQQVIHGRDEHFLSRSRLDTLHRHAARDFVTGAEVVELRQHGYVRRIKEGQGGRDNAAVLPVFEFQVPLAFFFPPAETSRSHRHFGPVLRFIPHEELPVAVLDARVPAEAVRPQQLAGPVHVRLLRRVQLNEQRRVRITLRIVDEIGGLPLLVEFFENDMVYGHPPRAVLSRVQRNPLVRVFGHLVEIRREHPHFGSVVARFSGKMTVGRACHV